MKDKPNLINVKWKLSEIIKEKENISVIFDAVNRTNEIVIQTYQFLRLWILNKYHLNLEIPKITKEIIMTTFKVIKKNQLQDLLLKIHFLLN
jgi:2-C-methyl-D-erythritol 4-phosphate cytidylyltransferase